VRLPPNVDHPGMTNQVGHRASSTPPEDMRPLVWSFRLRRHRRSRLRRRHPSINIDPNGEQPCDIKARSLVRHLGAPEATAAIDLAGAASQTGSGRRWLHARAQETKPARAHLT
jgi:hypothetical protein